MAVNKVDYFGENLIDLTNDTVTESTLLSGATAHDKSGNLITGNVTTADVISTKAEVESNATPGKVADALVTKELLEKTETLNTKVTDLSEQLSDYADIKEVKGDSIHITDSKAGNMVVTDFEKNLIPYPYNDGASIVSNGVTFTVNDDGSITANGTATALSEYKIRLRTVDKNFLSAGTYVLSGCPSGGGPGRYRLWFGLHNGTSWDINDFEYGDDSTFVIDNNSVNDQVSLYIQILSGFKANNLTFKPMIVEVAEDGTYPTEYIPPMGYEITSCGQNLIPYPYFSTSGVKNGITWTVDDDGTITANGTATANSVFTINPNSIPIKVKQGKKYRYNGCPIGGSIDNYRIDVNKNNASGGYISLYGRDYGNGLIITPTSDNEGISAYIYIISGQTAENIVFKPMLVEVSEDGTYPTEYQPYKGTKVTVSKDTKLPLYDLQSQDGITNIFNKYGAKMKLLYPVTDTGKNIIEIDKSESNNIVGLQNEIDSMSDNILGTKEEVSANTQAGKVADALVTKEMIADVAQLNQSIGEIAELIDHNNPRVISKDITSYYNDGSLWDRLEGRNGYKLFEDVYAGDYFQMSRPISAYERTNTYQEIGSEYVTIAGINTLMWNGDNANVVNYNHLVMVPGKGRGGKFHFGRSRMNSSNTTGGAYYNSEMHTTTIGAVVSAGSTASTATINQQLYAEFGAHLATTRELLSNSTTNSASAAGAGYTGTSNNWSWYDCQAVLMSEIEVYGANVFSSSAFDTGNACVQLPIFRDKRFLNNRSAYYWLKNVASSARFCGVSADGVAGNGSAGDAYLYVRPRFVLRA